MTDTPTTHLPPDPAPESPAPSKKRRPGLWLLALLPLLLTALLVWLTATSGGFAAAWRAAGWASGGALSSGRVSGTLWQGFTLEQLVWKTPEQTLSISSVQLDWTPSALWQGEWRIKRVRIGHVVVVDHPVPGSKTTPPAGLPESLGLPLRVRVDDLTLASVSTGNGSPLLYGVSARYAYHDHGHVLELVSLDSPWGQGKASLSIADQRPFAINGHLAAQGVIESLPVASGFGVSGSLEQLQLSGAVTGKTLSVQVNGVFAPFATDSYARIRSLDIQAGGINPHALWAGLPVARLNLAAYLKPVGNGVSGGISLLNGDAGELSQNRLPIKTVATEFRLGDKALTLNYLDIALPDGKVTLKGRVGNTLAVTALLQQVKLKGIHAQAPDDSISGNIVLSGSPREPYAKLKLAGKLLSLDGEAGMSETRPRKVLLPRLVLGAAGGQLALKGMLELDELRRFELAGQLARLDPSRFGPALPKGDLNARLTAKGRLDKGLEGVVSLAFTESRISGQPLSGKVDADLVPGRLKRILMDVALASNRIQAKGSWGVAGDRLNLALQAPALGLLGPGFAGSLNASADVSGTPAVPVLALRVKADHVQLPGHIAVQSLTGSGDIRADANSPFRLALSGEGIRLDENRLDAIRLGAEGTRTRHRLELDARLQSGNLAETVLLRASGGLDAAKLVWRGSLDRFEAGGKVPASLLAPVKLAVGEGNVEVGAARFSLAGSTLALASLSRKADGSLATRGQWHGVALAELGRFMTLPVKSTLVLDAEWSLAMARDWQGSVVLRRASGDILLPADGKTEQPLGLSGLDVNVALGGQQAQLSLNGKTLHGTLTGRASLPMTGRIPDARTPLDGSLQLRLPSLDSFRAFAPPSLELAGHLAADFTLSGPLAQPHWQGKVAGGGLLLSDRRTGIRLADGSLLAHVQDQKVELETLHFTGGKGDVSANGTLALNDSGPDARVRVVLRKFSVFDRPSRRLIVSGDAELALVNRRISLSGKLRADQGRVELARLGTPALSDDVVIKGRAAPEPSALASLPLSVDLTLDLGERFRFSGQGLDVELTGQAKLTAEPGMAPAAKGQVRVVKGRYKAYGQDLDIEYGVISFAGPLDNPGLNVRARRRLSPVGAGVEVTGSVATPQIRLIADESMSDKDKLAWLVLGRASSGSDSDNNNMAASAGTLLAGTLNDRIGLFDDLGMSQRNERTLSDGRVSPAEQVVTVGKQLTQEFYLGYEYGMTSAHQAVKMIYQLSKSWSLVLRAGTDASAETRYTLRFD